MIADLALQAGTVLATLMLWVVARAIAARIPVAPFSNPLVIGGILLCLGLSAARIAPGAYLANVRALTIFIPIATVALALPLWEQRRLIQANAAAMSLACLASAVTGIGTVLLGGWLLQIDPALIASAGPKATTLAVALPLSQATGGIDALAMAAVMFNGIGGMLISDLAFRLGAGRTGPEERAFALGVTSHAMGIARALSVSPRALSLASCGMLLSALLTALCYSLFLLIRG
ncbi:LrgB family protein [Xinfangfangia sp. D13-10-4-6]|uniref:LrgB family protein n=1 Tax=Pseudogemmobacter hezensis TaxID=2737662 RepID=UPI0015561F14|nr:LrgB family protein [Pseudogemmobacter hezensis]NPD16833.1 LrgB family protein [Pseudogemmobacter hezensis]